MTDPHPLHEFTRELFRRALEDDDEQPRTEPAPSPGDSQRPAAWREYVNDLFHRA